ncbi:MAG: DUF1294 domain-containing protein [Gammaproteobacteria bacterium]
MSRIYKKQKQLRDLSVLLVVVLSVLSGLLLSRWFAITFWFGFACYFISVNLVTWLVFFYDKLIAGRKDVVRVPESTLFLLAVAGGLPSTLVAMQVLRHKRAKSSFKWKLFIWFVVIYTLIGAVFWLCGDQLGSLVA